MRTNTYKLKIIFLSYPMLIFIQGKENTV